MISHNICLDKKLSKYSLLTDILGVSGVLIENLG